MRLEKIYLKRDQVALNNSDVAEEIKRVWLLHWQGKLEAAYNLAKEIDVSRLKCQKTADLFYADFVFLGVKVGHGLPESLQQRRLRNCVAKSIYHYARYSHYFLIDHKKAWAALNQFGGAAMVCGSLCLWMTYLFLLGHMMTVSGKHKIGYHLAGMIFKFMVFFKKSGANIYCFANDVVFSVFPYTVFAGRRLHRTPSVIDTATRYLSDDPYYQTVFHMSCLFAFAYSTDIARCEAVASRLETLNQRGKLLRYRPLAEIMPLLPLALRGYSHLIAQKYAKIVFEHKSSQFDSIINASFYRACAVIELCLNNKSKAEQATRKAMFYRRESRSFYSWEVFDQNLLKHANSTRGFNPGEDLLNEVFTFKSPPPCLSALLISLVRIIPEAIKNEDVFLVELGDLLASHFECRVQSVSSDAIHARITDPTIQIGQKFLQLRDLPTDRKRYVWGMLSGLAPTIRSLEMIIVESRNLADQMRKSSALVAVGRTTQLIAHDVRRPLSLLDVAMQQLAECSSLEETRSLIGRLSKELNESKSEVAELLDDIVHIGSSHVGTQELLRDREMISDALKSLRANASHKKISFAYDLNCSASILGDRHKLKRVFTNILENAVQATPHHGKINISSQLVFANGQRNLRLQIHNSGSFIPKDRLDCVFEAFFTDGKAQGTGLGLALAKEIVEAHRGRIWAESDRFSGTSFFVELPAAAEARYFETRSYPEALCHSEHCKKSQTDPSEKSFGAPSNLTKSTLELTAKVPARLGHPTSDKSYDVIVIDDSPFVLEAWQRKLKGVRVGFFRNPDECLQAMQENTVLFEHTHVIVCDYYYDSGQSASDFSKWVKTRFNVRVALSTCAEIAGDETKAFDAVLGKEPLGWEDLAKAVES